MQLWTNEANSATTTTVSSLSTVENFEDDEHRSEASAIKIKNENNSITEEVSSQSSFLLSASSGSTNHHSSTHSPTASSSSTSSLIGINNVEQLSPLQTNELQNNEMQFVPKINDKSLTPEKSENLLLLNVKNIANSLSSEQKNKKNECSLSVSPNGISSFLESSSNVGNNLMLFNAASSLQNAGREPMECLHCGIFFIDQTLYLLHKGLHSESDAWRCNLCGHTCSDKYTFTTHLISSDHS